jgi:hypothetical protein
MLAFTSVYTNSGAVSLNIAFEHMASLGGKSANDGKAFRFSIVFVDNLLECLIGIPLDVPLLFTVLELNQDNFLD